MDVCRKERWKKASFHFGHPKFAHTQFTITRKYTAAQKSLEEHYNNDGAGAVGRKRRCDDEFRCGIPDKINFGSIPPPCIKYIHVCAFLLLIGFIILGTKRKEQRTRSRRQNDDDDRGWRRRGMCWGCCGGSTKMMGFYMKLTAAGCWCYWTTWNGNENGCARIRRRTGEEYWENKSRGI